MTGRRLRTVGAAFLSPALLALAVAMPARAQAPAARADLYAYTMAPGDSLYGLARRYFMRADDYRTVQRLNRIADPQRIAIGRTISIPMSLLRGEELSARLIAARGVVSVMQGERTLPVALGMALEMGTALETGQNGVLTIELPNGSRTTLPTRSRLVIRKLRKLLLGGAIDYELEVSTGKAETEATPVGNGKGQFRVRTPRAVSAVRGTRFRVGYGGEDSSAEVLEGRVAVGSGDKTAEQVESGFGARISASGAIAQEALLPPVELVDPTRVQIDPLVELALRPVPGATGYHVQISRDSGFIDVVADETVSAPLVRVADLPNGNWFVRATAIAASGLEGQYQSQLIRRRLTGVSASADGDLDVLRFRWGGDGEGRRSYRFQMTGEDRNAPPVVDESGLDAAGIDLRDMKPGTYFWRVGVRQFQDGDMTEKWLPYEKLVLTP